MRSVVLLEPGPIDARTGGYIYNARVMEGLGRHGWSAEIRELNASFPRPTDHALAQAASTLASISDDTLVIVDSLALGAMADLVEREASRLRLVGLVHLPLEGEGERRALSAAALVVVTSPATLTMLAKYALPWDRVVIVEPGTDPVPAARGSDGPPLHLVCVATLIPRKGHEILLRALASVAHYDWHLTCAGSLTLDPATVERVRALAQSLGLAVRVSLVGELDAAKVAECYQSADLFVLATLQETYGMAVAEALAYGLPVISTRTGAIPELVGQGAGVLVSPGNTEELAHALEYVLEDADVRARLAEGARQARERLPSWDDAVNKMSSALASLA